MAGSVSARDSDLLTKREVPLFVRAETKKGER